MYFLVEYEPEIIFIDRDNYRLLNLAIETLATSEDVIIPPKIITFGKIEGKVEVDSLESILNGNFDKDEIDKFSCEKTKPIDIMAVMFSSNATSYPGKAHIRYFAFTYPANHEIPIMSPNDIGLWYGSLNWTHSMILTVRSIVSYVTVIKCSKFNDEDMYETIEKYKVIYKKKNNQILLRKCMRYIYIRFRYHGCFLIAICATNCFKPTSVCIMYLP